MANLSADAIESKARGLLDKRVAAVRAVADAQQRVNDANDEHRRAWRKALVHGWSDAELRDVGLTKPTFPRRSRSAAPAPSSADSSATTPVE